MAFPLLALVNIHMLKVTTFGREDAMRKSPHPDALPKAGWEALAPWPISQ